MAPEFFSCVHIGYVHLDHRERRYGRYGVGYGYRIVCVCSGVEYDSVGTAFVCRAVGCFVQSIDYAAFAVTLHMPQGMSGVFCLQLVEV